MRCINLGLTYLRLTYLLTYMVGQKVNAILY